MLVKKSRLDRLPLRDLLNQVEHLCREMTEHLQMDLSVTMSDFHRMTRTKRKKSSFPTVRSLCNNFEKLKRSYDYACETMSELDTGIKIIEERAREVI